MAPGRRGGGFAALARTFLLLLIAGGVQRVLGEIGSNVITRVVGGLVA
jgi:small neutral amino acid transporter SnatA (MarC family)